MKNIVTLALATPECRDVARFFNLKSELIAHASTQLGGCASDTARGMVGKQAKRGIRAGQSTRL